MKNLILFAFLLISGISFAQYGIDAPWMETLERSKAENEEPTFHEIVAAFNAYWEGKNPNVKGSGYKPFMRWQYHWRNYLKEDGTILTPQEIWNFSQQKQLLRTSGPQDTTDDDNSSWVTVGPFTHTNTGSWSSGQGRVNVIEVDPNNPNTYYIGAPAGGIWKSLDAGATWEPLSDYLPQIGVSAIAVDPANSNIIYIGTGDEDGGDTYSIGVLKSTDGGATWNTTGLTFNNTYSRVPEIYIHPTNSNVLIVATSDGLYKSTNAGTTFTLKQVGDFRDIKFKPNDPSTVYAVSNDRFYKSVNTGESYTMVTSGLPTSAGRQVLAVTPAAPNNVYILSANTDYGFQGVYKSTNTGNNFSRTDNGNDIFQSNQAWFDLAFDVSKTDANVMYVGVLDVWKSTNGGLSFNQWNNWGAPFGSTYTHADIHMIRFFGDELFFGTDGGLYKSSDGQTTTDLTAGLAIGQFYKISVSKQSSGNMVGGLQDNGGYAFSENNWKNYYGADGMDTAIDPDDPNKYYGFTQNGGGLYISSNGGSSITAEIPGPETGNWVTPLETNSEGELYAGYSRLYKLQGSNFVAVSNSFPGNIDCLEIDPINNDIIYASWYNNLYKSTDRGVSFFQEYSFPSDISSIAVNSTNNAVVYVTTTGNAGRVYKSTNSGSSFSDITFNLPNEPKLVIKHQALHSQNPIFVGTILGVYRMDDTANSWEVFGNNLPNVPVRDLEINLIDQNITAATYGRGIWQSPIPTEIPNNDIKLSEIVSPVSQVNCEDYVPSIVVENNGGSPITSFTVNYSTEEAPVQSFSWTGVLNPSESIDLVLPSMNLPRGHNRIQVVLQMPNDQYSINNILFSNIYFNDNGTAGDINTFENPTDDLVVIEPDPANPLWERGVPNGTFLDDPGSGSSVYGTNLNGHYPNNHTSYLVSQCYDLSTFTSPLLKFNLAYDLEQDYDVLYVEYSTNGNDWQLLGSTQDENWYNNNTPCADCPGEQWSGMYPFMEEYYYNLSNFTSETNFLIRFVFKSDVTQTREGAVIDDLVITEATMDVAENILNTAINVFPNPSADIFNIEISSNIGDVDLELVDITGKQIFSKQKIRNATQVDLSPYASGVYLLQIKSAEASIVKKLIKL